MSKSLNAFHRKVFPRHSEAVPEHVLTFAQHGSENLLDLPSSAFPEFSVEASGLRLQAVRFRAEP